MKILLIFLTGVVGGVWGTLLWQRAGRRAKSSVPHFSEKVGDTSFRKGGIGEKEKSETLIERQKREKEEDKERIYALLETNTPLTVGDVKSMLGIPESTATRYFDELEKEGRVRQVGTTGAGVHYERIGDADNAERRG